MPAPITCAADFRATPRAFAVLTPAVGAPRRVNVDVRGLDPFATAAGRAVYAVLGGIFLIFPIPGLLELEVKEAIDVF